MASQEDIVAAIGLIADRAGGPLSKKPTVDALRDEIGPGAEVSADERDAAWEVFQAQSEDAEEDKSEPEKPEPSSGTTRVRNRHGSPLSIGGVTVPVDGEAEVPGLDAGHRWFDAGLIERV